ncbi:hypothetical protein FRB94_007794 [Tulasnella sp. JGI-2019a]|nr:hypothetical protein FRB93_006799 [Tulasnella sp. JGI-2019a]KAG8997264.1 hypothetical protein FRB94_007794 [Tulasnella sp. JGI-2019a]
MDRRQGPPQYKASPAPDLALLPPLSDVTGTTWSRYGSAPTAIHITTSDAGAATAGTSASKSKTKSPGIFRLPSPQHQHQPQAPSAPPSRSSDEWSRGSATSGPNSTSGSGGSGKQNRFMTLVFQDKETVLMMPRTYKETQALARNWVQPPEGTVLHLRVPVEYVSLTSSRFLQGPYLWIANEETYHIATHNVHGIRVEVVSEAPPLPGAPL